MQLLTTNEASYLLSLWDSLSCSNKRVIETIDNMQDGCGIHPDIVNTIFDLFVTTKRCRGAIGLSLHIIYNLVHQLLKGKIRLSSAKNTQSKVQRTLFIVEIPLDLSAEKSESISTEISN